MPTAERKERQKQMEEQRARDRAAKERIESASQKLRAASLHHDDALQKLVNECSAWTQILPPELRQKLTTVRVAAKQLDDARAMWAAIEKELQERQP